MLADSTAQNPLPGPTQHSYPSETSTSIIKTRTQRLRKIHTAEQIPDSSDLKTISEIAPKSNNCHQAPARVASGYSANP